MLGGARDRLAPRAGVSLTVLMPWTVDETGAEMVHTITARGLAKLPIRL